MPLNSSARRVPRKAVRFYDLKTTAARAPLLEKYRHAIDRKKIPGGVRIADSHMQLGGLEVFRLPRRSGGRKSVVAFSMKSAYPAHEKEHAEILAAYDRAGLSPHRFSIWAVFEEFGMITRMAKDRADRRLISFSELAEMVRKNKIENASQIVMLNEAISKNFPSDGDYRRALFSLIRSPSMRAHIRALGNLPLESSLLASAYRKKVVNGARPHLLSILDFLAKRALQIEKTRKK